MPKHPSRDFRNFYIQDTPKKIFCPLCHYEVRYVIPAEMVTYLVHYNRPVCVIDNVVAVKNG